MAYFKYLLAGVLVIGCYDALASIHDTQRSIIFPAQQEIAAPKRLGEKSLLVNFGKGYYINYAFFCN